MVHTAASRWLPVGGVTALALNLWALDRNGLGNSSYAATPPVLLVRSVDTATLRQPEPTPPPPLPTNLPRSAVA